MAKLTVTDIKKQIAALEAKAARLAGEETKVSVGRVRALMNQLGVTIEHLSSAVASKGAAVKRAIVGSQAATKKRAGKGVAKYQDPKTGATWSGFGRAPGWIAGATNREAFLVGKGKGGASKTGAIPPLARKAAAKKSPAKKGTVASVKRAVNVATKALAKAAAPASAKKRPSIKAAATKAAARKAAKKTAVSGGAGGVQAGGEGSGTAAT